MSRYQRYFLVAKIDGVEVILYSRSPLGPWYRECPLEGERKGEA